MKLTQQVIRERVHSEADAYLLLEELRWHGEPVCAHCGHDKAYFLNPSNGATRATGPKRTPSVRRVWKCAKCRKQFSVLTNTIFHGTKISLVTWLYVLCDVSSAKNGISAREVGRKYEITRESAWHMVHRIREAMKREPLVGMLSGTIVADEAWIGGDPSNRHKGKPTPGRGPTDKTAIVALVNKETGEVRTQVVPSVDGGNLRKVIERHVNVAESELHTDQWVGYSQIGPEFRAHKQVNHSWGEYVRDGATTNHAEGYFSQLKRSLDGTFHAVSVEHLPRYLAEFDFRYSTCKMTDSDRALRIIEQSAGRRLSYEPLRGGGSA